MSKKNKKRDEEKQESTPRRPFYDIERPIHRIIPCLLLAIGVLCGFFLTLNLFGKNNSPLGDGTVWLLKGLFSHAMYVIPVLLIWQAARWRADVEKKHAISRAFYYFAFLVMYGALRFYVTPGKANIEHDLKSFFSGNKFGLLGGSLGYWLCELTGYIGVPFLFAVIILLFVTHFLGISPYDVFRAIRDRRRAARASAPLTDEESRDLSDLSAKEQAEENFDDEDDAALPSHRPSLKDKLAQKRQAKLQRRQEELLKKKQKASEQQGYFPQEGVEESFKDIRRRMEEEALLINRERMSGSPVSTYVTPEADPYVNEPDPGEFLSSYTPRSGSDSNSVSADSVFSTFDPLAFDSQSDPTVILRPKGMDSSASAFPAKEEASGFTISVPSVDYPRSHGVLPGQERISPVQEMHQPSVTHLEEPASNPLPYVHPATQPSMQPQPEWEEEEPEEPTRSAEPLFPGLTPEPAPYKETVVPEVKPEAISRPEVVPSAYQPKPSAPTTIPMPTPPKATQQTVVNRRREDYVFPPLSLLKRSVPVMNSDRQSEIDETCELLTAAYAKFKIDVTVQKVVVGPRITRYCISPPDGVRINQLIGLANDIALALSVESLRIIPVPNTPYLGVEIPNRTPTTVRLSSLIDTDEFRRAETDTFVPLGASITGETVFIDIGDMPHGLIAGATGMGKSVLMNSILISLLYRAHPDDLKLILVDPKRVELSMYNGIPHLLVPPIVEAQKTAGALNWAVGEMERRYSLMSEANVRSIRSYNAAVKKNPELGTPQPTIVIVIDELNEIMMQVRDAVEPAIVRIAQKARAAGIHLLVGTQRPSVDVITGLIKSNIPTRVALHVSSGTDSRTILDQYGAEKLLDKGDMLASIRGTEPIRAQSAFVSDEEVENVTAFLRQNAGPGVYDECISAQIDNETEKYKNSGKRHADRDEEGDDDLEANILEDSKFMKVCQVTLSRDTISATHLQSTCAIGFPTASRYIRIMENMGIIGPAEGSKPRRVIMTQDQFMEMVSRETYSGD